MKKTGFDFSKLHCSWINDPRYSHLKLLWAWPGYFVMYFLTESLIAAEKCHAVQCRLDKLIPFNEIFVVPYVLWYFLVAGSLLYFALYDVDSFKKLMKYIIITQVAAMAVYIIFPSRQDLRPHIFPRDNFLTDCVALLYSLDTSTNVCPSLHVAYSLGIASAWLKSAVPKKGSRISVMLFCILVCFSTVFIKQHSVLDALAAVPLCLAAELMSFGMPGKRKSAEVPELPRLD